MYLNYWPESDNRMGSLPVGYLDANRAKIFEVAAGAARAYVASQTTAPVSSFRQFGANLTNDVKQSLDFMRSAGARTPDPTEAANAFVNAPQVVPLNPETWSAPRPAEVMPCGMRYSGVPWADAGMYRPALGGSGTLADWMKANPLKSLLLALAGGFGLYSLGEKK
jgi:hypothetical protein